MGRGRPCRSDAGEPPAPGVQIHGYYDLATPFAWGDYDLAHLTFDDELRRNIDTLYYETGHMPFADDDVLARMTQDLDGFYQKAVGP